ncbi:MAG: nucleotidyltransferase family protein [Candidatus Sumerlaeaceae bacterium]
METDCVHTPGADLRNAASAFQDSTHALAVMVTRRCNMTCGHCSVESAPRVSGRDPSELELLQLVREAGAAGIDVIQFTGGEPMLRPKVVLRLIQEANRLGIVSGMATNGYWGKKPRQARLYLRQMVQNRLEYLTISYDRYHAEFMGPEPILNIAAAAKEIGFYINVNVTRVADDPELEHYTELFGSLPFVRMRFYDVQPIGRARDLNSELRSEIEGFCSAVAQAAVGEDGRVLACNGPAYFQPESSPLYLGRMNEAPLGELLARHWNDPVLATIRTFGPTRLRDELQQVPQFENYFRDQYSGQCDLCLHITSNPDAVEVLRDRLSDPRHVVERRAKESIMHAARQTLLNRDYINGPGVGAMMLSAALGNGWPADTSRILGRADLDWNHLLDYVCACGMAGALVVPCQQEAFARWAPSFFQARLQQRATRDALRELSQRQALEQVGAALREIGSKGILLKGLALRALDLANGHGATSRIPGDMDILVQDATAAETLRRRLLESGFAGEPDAPRTGPHHLAPISYRGVPLEIHTEILPSFWGYPEDALTQLISVSDKYPLFVPRPEAMILHEGIHTTTHMFSHGLKLAFDLARILRVRQIEWNEVEEMAAGTKCPRAFWTPVRVLARELPQLQIPDEFLGRAPADGRQQRLELIAGKRLFSEIESAEAMNPFSRNAIFLMLFDSVFRRAGYLVSLATGPAAESRRAAFSGRGQQAIGSLPEHLKLALRDWRSYRRATRFI